MYVLPTLFMIFNDNCFLQLLRQGTGLTTGSDSELITQLLSHPPPEGEPDGPDWVAR